MKSFAIVFGHFLSLFFLAGAGWKGFVEHSYAEAAFWAIWSHIINVSARGIGRETANQN